MIEVVTDQLQKGPPQSFEPVVQAVIAAMAAQDAAWRTNWMLVIVIMIGMIIILLNIYMVIEINKLKHQTNGILQMLLLATRKLGLVEGEAIGRAAEHGSPANITAAEKTEIDALRDEVSKQTADLQKSAPDKKE